MAGPQSAIRNFNAQSGWLGWCAVPPDSLQLGGQLSFRAKRGICFWPPQKQIPRAGKAPALGMTPDGKELRGTAHQITCSSSSQPSIGLRSIVNRQLVVRNAQFGIRNFPSTARSVLTFAACQSAIDNRKLAIPGLVTPRSSSSVSPTDPSTVNRQYPTSLPTLYGLPSPVFQSAIVNRKLAIPGASHSSLVIFR
jgi:hypothetical protein